MVRLLTLQAVSEATALSMETIYRLTQQGALPVIRVGGARRVDERDLEAFVAAHRVAAKP